MSIQDVLKKSFLKSFGDTNSTTSIAIMVTALALALIFGLLICLAYNKFYRGVVYNRSFAITIVGMSVMTAMVTLAISTNVVISLGMVGALSIVRFRTAIKDPMDTVYMFWAISVGITVGANFILFSIIGTLVIAGHTAARKLFAFTDMPLTAMASACSTYVSQNYGANHPDRVRRGMRDIYLYGVVVAVTAILLMSVGAEWMVKLVSGSSEPVVLENGVRYLVWNAPFYAVLGMLLSTRYALQSMGEKVLPLLSSVIEFLGKIVFVLLFIPRFEYNAVILCEPVIWCFMTIELLIAYRHNSFVFPKKK